MSQITAAHGGRWSAVPVAPWLWLWLGAESVFGFEWLWLPPEPVFPWEWLWSPFEFEVGTLWS